jgi:hypothetical protein
MPRAENVHGAVDVGADAVSRAEGAEAVVEASTPTTPATARPTATTSPDLVVTAPLCRARENQGSCAVRAIVRAKAAFLPGLSSTQVQLASLFSGELK